MNRLLNKEITQEEYLNEKNTTLLFRELPFDINGLIICYRDIKIVFINQFLKEKNMYLALLHELLHIELKHFESVYDISFREQEVKYYISKFN